MKRFFCSLLAASMFAVPALAESDAAALAQSLVPESAVLISQEKEDGFTSFEYWVDSSQEFVEILIDPAPSSSSAWNTSSATTMAAQRLP